MNFWDTLDPKYRLILCDLWGVVHNGVELYPGAAERLRRWRHEGRGVILLTNAPRTAQSVEEQLGRIGLPGDCWDMIVTSGEAGIAALNALEEPVGFIGTADDRAVLEGRGVRIADDGNFTDLACTGLRESPKGDPQHYRAELEGLVERDVHMHCLNPDRIVVRAGVPEACAGALADVYQMLGGRVTWYGKPFPAIYEHALSRGGNPPKDEVLAVGDGLQTDILGAARMGFDTVFVAGGIHAGEAFPQDFAERNGLGDWRPVAVVDGLA
ncbi:MAG TPA: TIGR01459 family HAD-type hydrolase [Sphingomicrobium sp.]|nr:TIGR01459 family HAD-type hydrolase [Sphingomicrobium sp.]